MRIVLIPVVFLLLIVAVLAQVYKKPAPLAAKPAKIPVVNVKGTTVASRFNPPTGYAIVKTTPGSFAAYLQQMPLKPAGTQAVTYKGDVASTEGYTAAIIDMSIGSQNLQQCADAVIRLRAEYLYSRKKYDAISFNFTSGFKCDFLHYANGYRFINDRWVLKAGEDYSYENFLNYMNLVFTYAGTLSLQKELQAAQSADLQPGDVFIKGGSPGHCFIVMNVAVNSRGDKKFLLAQSFMPAQSIQILQMWGNPWFSLEPSGIPYGQLIDKNYLKRF
ncbi:hypothetical protein DJ568_06765 [Mucilaginibacter hurinus]|uniref:DUF4846 domain-containing protein n=1 Tax=Mucilaginibacter hurinus TaxID=2201324 RepID=A0A367GR97_9SPHI|nr:DUF4846 domain-containing protein [Mucilaginibacter hurinus]RCH55588.1 hypothetical protein DJ568_06765 [Mucilaginibacter hurinus]